MKTITIELIDEYAELGMYAEIEEIYLFQKNTIKLAENNNALDEHRTETFIMRAQRIQNYCLQAMNKMNNYVAYSIQV
jgi:hypothetical protein